MVGTRDSIRRRTIRFVACPIAFAALATIVALAVPAAAADDNEPASYTPVYHPKLEIARINGEIRIDGVLDDPGWRTAAKATNFAAHHNIRVMTQNMPQR